MIPFCCFRCFQYSFPPDGICCFPCHYIEESTTSIIEKFQPAVPESGNESPGYYVSVSDASTQANDDFPPVEPTRDASAQANDDDFPPVEPTRDSSTQTTDCDLSFLAHPIGCHRYREGYKIIYPSQVRAMEVFNQYFDDNYSLMPENFNYCNGYGINIDNCNKAYVGSLIVSLNNAHVAPKQWTNLNNVPQSNEGLIICNSEENLNQRTGYAGQINDDGNLNFDGSFSYRSACSMPNTYLESSENENTLGDSAEKSNSYLTLPEKRKDPLGDNHYEGIAMIIKAELEHSSGKSQKNLFKQNGPENSSLEYSKLSFAGSISDQSECPLLYIYQESSINKIPLEDSSEKSNANLILPKKRNNSSSDNHYEGNEEAHISVKSRRNLFKQKVPEKRLPESDKLSLAGSISYQSECSLPNTNPETSKEENTLGDSEEKSNTNLVLPKKRNNSSSDNHYEGKEVLKKAVLDQEAQSSVKSRRNLFKQKVPKKRLLECGKENLAGSFCNQSECSIPNTYPESSKNKNTFEDNSEKSNGYLVLPEKRKKFCNDNHSEGNPMLRKADLDHSSGKSRRNLFKQKVPEKRSLECKKRTSPESVQKRSMAVPFHFEKEAILPSSNTLKKRRSLKNHFSDRELHSSGISNTSVLKVEVPVNKPLKCGKCRKLFRSTSRLKVHEENNCDPEPYKCDHCDKQYPSEHQLIVHRVVHSKEKPFRCNRCGYASKWEKNLQLHKNAYHRK